MKPIKAVVLIVLAIFTFLIGCQSEKSKPVRKASEVQLIARLSVDLVSNPRTQKELDQNAIINYAIDHMLDVRGTPSGIYYQIVTEGAGNNATLQDQLTAHYKGMLLNGKEFDSSYRAGRPLDFNLRKMIKGWQIAVPYLKPGGRGVFLIPSELAYGATGYSNLIPPNTPLLFEIELIDIR